MSTIDSPIPLSEIETVLAWVDTFKLSRPTKKISRDFSDAVLLAEILSVHYPKLVEMHNYPPRNSHSLKLNNWMTLNRKVLKKLKLYLCCNTMEQLANSAPGVIERVLVMVRDKIHRDEDLNKSMKEAEQNVSSGGSYYEACGDEENVLVVPHKTRVNGVLETVQQKVVSYESFQVLKVGLKDAKDSIEVLKQKVDHLDSLIKLKDERIDELQKQLDRKQSRRKEVETYQNSLAVPFDSLSSISHQAMNAQEVFVIPGKTSYVNAMESISKIPKLEESKIPVPTVSAESNIPVPKVFAESNISRVSKVSAESNIPMPKVSAESNTPMPKVFAESNILPTPKVSAEFNMKTISKPSITEVTSKDTEANYNVEKIKSDVFKDIEIIEDNSDVYADIEEFKDSEPGIVTTIADTIQNEIKNITIPLGYRQDMRLATRDNVKN